MGVFYVDDNDSSIINSKSHLQEIRDIANECRELTKRATKEVFPNYLWTASINEFENDDYKLRGTCTDPNVLKAYSLGRKYSDYWDYLDAIEAYYAYVDFIDNSYGSFEMLKRADEDGYGTVYIPKKPKLTNKKKNKLFVQSGFLPSRIDYDLIVDEEDIDAALSTIALNEINETENIELTKMERRLQTQLIESKNRTDRIRGIYSSYGTSSQGMDAIVKFLTGSEDYNFNASGKESESFSAEMDSIHEFDYLPQCIIDDLLEPKSPVLSNGILFKPVQKEQLDILEQLERNGYDFLKTGITAGMDKRAIRMITKRYGSLESRADLTPKQLKKLKKKEAKAKKRQQDSLVADRRLQDALLQNKIHFSGSAADFTLADIIPEYE